MSAGPWSPTTLRRGARPLTKGYGRRAGNARQAFAAVASTLFLGGWQLPGAWGISDGAMNAIGPIMISTKAVLLVGVVFWVRFSLPRFREDQLQKLAWKVLIPLALANIVVTGVMKVVF